MRGFWKLFAFGIGLHDAGMKRRSERALESHENFSSSFSMARRYGIWSFGLFEDELLLSKDGFLAVDEQT